MDSYFSLDYLIQQLEQKAIASTTKQRLQNFIDTLNQPKIDLKRLRELSSYGVPDDLRGLRSLVWKLLMGFLPTDRSKWRQCIDKNYQQYESFCQDFIKSKIPHKQMSEYENMTDEQIKGLPDHPLSRDRQSTWKSFFEDQTIWEEVEKDTIRTRAEFSFFVSPVQQENKYPVYFRTQCRRERRQQQDYEYRHYDVLTRMLFIYAKLNPAIKYVQGMNEILAPFYFVFYSDTSEIFLNTVESDAFFCFTIFMSDAKDCFLRSNDDYQDGIQSRMQRLNAMIQQDDWEVWKNLNKLNIHPQFYSLRWIMLYLTQEFDLHQVFRIWDSLLTKQNRNDYLLQLCLGIVHTLRKELLQDDFTDVMECLQRISHLDIDLILQYANR